MNASNKVQRWLDSYSRFNTRERYGSALTKFCTFYDVTPDQTLTWSLETIEDNMQDWVVHLVKKDLAGSTIRLNFTGVKQWFKFNRKRIDVQCKNVSNGRRTLDYIPSRDDVRRLLDSAKLKHKVAIALIAFAGLRPVDVVTLQLKHIRASLDRGDDVLTIEKCHEKTKEWYVSFLGYQGSRYVRDYLQTRENRGEQLTDESYLVDYRGEKMHSQGLRLMLGDIIKASVGRHPEGPNKVFKPYSLRKYFRRTASRLGDVTAEYLMGHTMGLKSLVATYSGLRDLDRQAIRQLKEQYTKILDELETELPEASIKARLQEQKEGQTVIIEELRAQLKEEEHKREWQAARLAEIGKGLDELKEWAVMMRDRDREEAKKKKG